MLNNSISGLLVKVAKKIVNIGDIFSDVPFKNTVQGEKSFATLNDFNNKVIIFYCGIKRIPFVGGYEENIYSVPLINKIKNIGTDL